MTITINGNGTVTGISVGGLPDGIVDTDMLADTAVSTAKIADTAVSTVKIADEAATDAKRGPGSILQMAFDSDGTQIDFASTSWADTGLSITFTPKRADSTLYITATYQFYSSGNGSYHGEVQAKIDHDGGTIGELQSSYSPLNDRVNVFQPITATVSAGSTSSRVIKVQVKDPDTNGNAAHYNLYAGKSTLTVMEIGA